MKKPSQMLRDDRVSRGISQKFIAQKTGFSIQKMSQIEHGNSRVTAEDFLRIIIDGFGTTPQLFFDDQLSKAENLAGNSTS